MRTPFVLVCLLLAGASVSAQAPSLKAALAKAQEAEQRALALVQATDEYKAYKAASEARQQLEALVKAEAK